MNFFAGSISRAGVITIIILCVVAAVFLLADLLLVLYLHRQNKKLEQKRELPAPDDDNRTE